MTKRLLSLMLALIMLFSLCMTACSTPADEEAEEGEEEQQEEVQRPNVGLTIYAIKDKKMTDEALKAVEEKVSNYCIAKYKTAIQLRFFTEEEYQAALDQEEAEFAAQAIEKMKAEEEAAAIAKSEAAYKAKLSPEERVKYDQKKRMEAKKKADEEKKKAEAQAELIERGEDKAVFLDTQMDIVFIPGQAQYLEMIRKEKLVDMKTFLDNTYKKIRDYVYPSFMLAATVDGGVFGIPNNRDINTNETYLVLNTALVEKYGVDLTKVRSITDLESAFAAVKAGSPGVTPIYGDFDPEGVVFYEGVDMAHTTCVFADNLLGGTQMATTTNAALNPASTASDAMSDYFRLKADWRAKGYLSDTNANFFASVQELTEAEKKEWEAKGYTLHLYKGATVTDQAVLDAGLFGISTHCQYPERAMEIIKLMSTDSELHNLLTFGIEEVHYIVNADNENVITVVDDSYAMDFYKTGNALLGYVTSEMDPDYVAKAKEKNLNSFVSPFLGYRYDWASDENEKWMKGFAEWKAVLDPIYAQLSYGTANWKQILTDAYQELRYNENQTYTVDYGVWQSDCLFRSGYKTQAEKVKALKDSLGTEDQTEAEGAVAPVTTTTAATTTATAATTTTKAN